MMLYGGWDFEDMVMGVLWRRCGVPVQDGKQNVTVVPGGCG
jgi:hypothetical protein